MRFSGVVRRRSRHKSDVMCRFMVEILQKGTLLFWQLEVVLKSVVRLRLVLVRENNIFGCSHAGILLFQVLRAGSPNNLVSVTEVER